MLSGVLGAASQGEFRRILSFHIISQIGYMILGLGLVTPFALAGSIFYVIHHILVKTNLFLVSGAISKLTGTYELKELGGLYKSGPGLSALFLIPALSLAGIPPLSGFWGKLVLIKEGLETGHYLASAVALLVGLLTLFSMMKIWSEVFWKSAPAGLVLTPVPHLWRSGSGILLLLPIVSLALFTLLISLLVQPILSVALRAAEQLTQPMIYIEAVLGRTL
jgi:multicomponent Na+:H+ antiporter subunit D